MKKSLKKLTLCRETLQELRREDLTQPLGAIWPKQPEYATVGVTHCYACP